MKPLVFLLVVFCVAVPCVAVDGPTWVEIEGTVYGALFALAYNLGNFLRRLALPKSVKTWSLRTLREKLIRIGAKVVKHSRYVVFQVAEVVVPRTLFREILERIGQLRASPELAGAG